SSFHGFKVVEIPEYGFPAGKKTIPFFSDGEGYVYLTRGFLERIHADPFRDQILFELAVHYSFRLNFSRFIREGGAGEVLIQKFLEGLDLAYGKDIFILNYLPAVSRGRIQGEREKGFGSFHLSGDENEAVYHLAHFLERYAFLRKVGYRLPGSDRTIGGPEDTYLFGRDEWLDFKDSSRGKSFLTLPGKLAIFLESLEEAREIKVGASTISKEEIDPEFRVNLPRENQLYIGGMVYDYSKGSRLDLPKIWNVLGRYTGDRYVTGLAATFVRRYGNNQRHFIRDLFEIYQGEDLIQIILPLNRLSRKTNLKDSERNYAANEADQLMNLLNQLVRVNSLESVLNSLEELNAIYDLLNQRFRPFGEIGPVMRMLSEFLRNSKTKEETCLIAFREILSSTDPKNLIPLLETISNDPGAITDLSRIKFLLKMIKEKNIDFSDLKHLHKIPLSLFETLLVYSSSPQKDLRILSGGAWARQSIEDGVRQNIEDLYRRGYHWIHAIFFKSIRGFLDRETEIEMQVSKDPHFVPTVQTKHPRRDYHRNELDMEWSEEEDDFQLLIFASKFLKTDSGKPVPFNRFSSLLANTAGVLYPLLPEDYAEREEALDSYCELKDRLFRFAVRLLKKDDDDLDPILFAKNLSVIVQRMTMDQVASLLDCLEAALDGSDRELINPFVESLTYFAESMSYEEGRDGIGSALEDLRQNGLARSLESTLQRRLAHETRKFPETPLMRMVAQIEGLGLSRKADLFRKLRVVSAYEPVLAKKTKRELQTRALEIRSLVSSQSVPLDEVKLEYLAIMREMSKRLYGMRAYNVQLASVLLFFENEDRNPRGLAEQVKTGEGKSLIIALTAGLSALSGKPVDIFTVNTYLAKRDAVKFKRLYDFLGLKVDYVKEQDSADRSLKKSNADTFSADIVYGTNSNFEFLYLYELIDQTPIRAKKVDGITVKREFATAIVDEVDSLFLDEAVNPHLISGFGRAMPTWHYKPIYRFIQGLTPGSDYRGTDLTPAGELKYRAFVEQLIQNEGEGKSQFSEVQLKRYARSALYAQHKKKDVDYVVEKVQKIKWTPYGYRRVEEEDIILVDKATGRRKEGSAWTHGLHQFVQIKEGIDPEEEFKPGVSITHPFYFKMYDKIYAITGTIGSETDEKELLEVYGLNSVRFPSHKPSLRIDHPDYVARTLEEKWNKVVKEVQRYHSEGRPVLVGVMTIRESEELHTMLRENGIEAQVLNGSQREPEEHIVQRAGQKGVVTVATNLAGRGTDILLGPEVEELGGLHVIGTQRFDARRIDDQLRGRSGRQGQPGSSQFIISLQDQGFRRYLGPLAELLEQVAPHSQKTRQKAAVEIQKRAEFLHYQWRRAQNRIYSVQDDQMNRFFKKIEEYFNTSRIYGIFPELVREFEKERIAHMDKTQSLFVVIRDLVLDYWTSHLQLLDDLTEEFGSGRKFESALSNYKSLAEESFQDVFSKLKRDAYSFYGFVAGLSASEVSERIAGLGNGSTPHASVIPSESAIVSQPQGQLPLANREEMFLMEAEFRTQLTAKRTGGGSQSSAVSTDTRPEEPPNSIAYWLARALGLDHNHAAPIGILGLAIEIPALIQFGLQLDPWGMTALISAFTLVHALLEFYVVLRDNKRQKLQKRLPTASQILRQLFVFVPYALLSFPDFQGDSILTAFIASFAVTRHLWRDWKFLGSTEEEKVAKVLVQTILAQRDGKDVDVEKLLDGTGLSLPVNSIGGIRGQENLFLQAWKHLNPEKLETALAKEFQSHPDLLLSKEEARLHATQALYHGVESVPISRLLKESKIKKTS
ncbi:MAG: hypothetical protein HY610_01925, partial [Elusimicrobia bacterium]|nr:hypothetical protein [Elusimicrobiota bacterium]